MVQRNTMEKAIHEVLCNFDLILLIIVLSFIKVTQNMIKGTLMLI